eukprot:COSAG05_NODE_79_length_21178_cov_133.299492_12_plen_47_part_00
MDWIACNKKMVTTVAYPNDLTRMCKRLNELCLAQAFLVPILQTSVA